MPLPENFTEDMRGAIMRTILENFGEEALCDSITQCHTANYDNEKGMRFFRKHSIECGKIIMSFEEEISEETFEEERGNTISGQYAVDPDPNAPIEKLMKKATVEMQQIIDEAEIHFVKEGGDSE